MKILILFLILIYSSTLLALGGKGPMAMNKDGLRNNKPVYMDKIGIDEKLGDQIDLSLNFTDDHGALLPLSTYFTDKPVFMVLNYYNCPTLCNTHLNQLMSTLRNFDLRIGKDFNFVVISIDPKETSKDSSRKKTELVSAYGDNTYVDNWHFLTGSQEAVDAITSQIGFKYAWDFTQKQWAHGAASYVLTTTGKLSYYHYGIDVTPKVFKLSLIEAGSDKIGNVLDRMVLFCLQYDPTKKTYAFYAFNIMKVGAFLMALLLAIFLFQFWRKENKTQI